MYPIDSAIQATTDQTERTALVTGPGGKTRAVLIFACGPGARDIIVGDIAADRAAVAAVSVRPSPRGGGLGARGNSGTAVTGPRRLPHWEQ